MKNTTLFLAAITLLVSCSKQTETATKESEDSKTGRPRIEMGMDGIFPVGKCRMVGTIVSIDERYTSPDAKNPCAQAPCRAVVRIDSILGYGSSFGAPLSIGQQVTMHFMFTLNPTKELFKDMAMSLPGLKVGSRFRADVEGGAEQTNAARATVSTYVTIE